MALRTKRTKRSPAEDARLVWAALHPETHSYLALCVREFPDGRVCRERLTLVDTRLVRDEAGRARQERVGECPSCGRVVQAIYHEGLTTKRHVTRRQRVRGRGARAGTPGP